jgi:hypothetical protein
VSASLGVVLGLLVGLRHAFEPDHLAAVSTLVSETRDPRRGALLGAVWGIGHTLALVAVGIALIALGAVLPDRLAAAFELAVAVMLLVLGARVLVQAARTGAIGPQHAHRHGGREHEHPGAARHVHVGRWTLAWRPLLVGMIHGLAGSGALTALVFAELPGTAARVVYIALFGAGSVAGMALASGVAGATLRTVARSHRVHRGVLIAVGVTSIVVGVAWGLPLVPAVLA